MLELCSEREEMLTVDEDEAMRKLNSISELSLEEFHALDERLGAALEAAQMFRELKLSWQRAQRFGISGGDMRVAYREAGKIPGCRVVLGDRLQSITKQRAYGALSLWESIRYRLVEMRHNSLDEVEKRKSSAYLQVYAAILAAACPTVYRAILQERDALLAEELKRCVSEPLLTMESPRGRVAVGVVGMNHVAGIKRAWNSPPLSPEGRQKLLAVPPKLPRQMHALGVMPAGWLLIGGKFLLKLLR
ncbi:traB domain-containing protein-like [Paramacrobiotus metropolitanus]|uniref:traB domain-containing protein-like n=1 Tax=Paramacrobiotus metropolitanus TaxID=2943436 RepID=UPI002445F6C0|nr:traB domain-containing protein-like [Paramacrobiotus metropolitanus]